MISHCVSLNKSAADNTLFVIPGIGGRTEMFRPLGAALEGDLRVYGLNMAGTESGETPLPDIAAIARQNIAWMTAAAPVDTLLLIGHSFGAFVAYEMARQLEQLNQPVDGLFILDQETPLVRSLGARNDAIGFAIQLARGYYCDFRVVDSWPEEWTAELIPCLLEKAPLELAAVIQQYVTQKAGARKRLIDLASRFIQLRMVNALMDYRPDARLRCPIVLYKAKEEHRVDVDGYLGWQGLADHLSAQSVPGNHISMVLDGNAPCLAQRIGDAMRSFAKFLA